MPSSWSPSLRFELQFTGENINLWGDKLDTVLSHADYTIAGWLTKALATSPYALTTANAGDDEARAAMLKFTGTGSFTVTIPSVSKSYMVWNACTGDLIVSTGSGSTVTLATGDIRQVFCDGTNVKQAGFGGSDIKTYVDNLAWTYNAGALPAQAGNAGKLVTTDGSVASWTAGFPDQTGNAGKFLKTDGATKTWDAIDASDITTFSASAVVTRTGTSTTAALTPGDTYNALAEVTITYAASVAPDMATFLNAIITLTGNITLANPTNPKVGQTGWIRLVQDGTGSRLLSAVGSSWKRAGGTPTLTTTASATDVLVYQVLTSTYILYDVIKSPS